MKTKDRKRTIIILLLILNLAFIFGNSMLNSERSKAVSDTVITIIEKVTGVDITTGDEAFDEHYGAGHYVRKAAHMTEFAILGLLCVMLFMYEQYSVTRFKSVVVFGLSVPLLDEGIQFFTGRGSELVDVYRDILGFSIGAAIMIAVKLRKKPEKD